MPDAAGVILMTEPADAELPSSWTKSNSCRARGPVAAAAHAWVYGNRFDLYASRAKARGRTII